MIEFEFNQLISREAAKARYVLERNCLKLWRHFSSTTVTFSYKTAEKGPSLRFSPRKSNSIELKNFRDCNSIVGRVTTSSTGTTID